MASSTAPPADIVGEPRFWTLPPWHHCEVKTPGGATTYWIRIDSDDGRTYETLPTPAERLVFIAAHAQEVRQSVTPDSTFYHDVDARKKYRIRRGTLEYQGLQKLARPEDGSLSWPEGSVEQAAVVAYFKAHAHEVRDVPVRPE